jgi:hypothetical protein
VKDDADAADELELRSLAGDEGLHFLLRRWKYTKPGTEAYLRRILEKNPTSGLYSKKKASFVSGIMTNSNGLMGMLSTEPSERNKGHASIVMRHLIKQIATDGLAPGSAVEQKNIASANFHKKVGMRFSHEADYVFHVHAPFS